MTTEASTKSIGKALYLEYRHGDSYATQVILVPELRNTSPSLPWERTRFTMYRRQVSVGRPRTKWRSAISNLHGDELSELRSAAAPLSNEQVSQYLAGFQTYLDNLNSRGWRLNRSAIVVDVTLDDAAEVAGYKTPHGILRRINKSRKTLGFSDALWGPE